MDSSFVAGPPGPPPRRWEPRFVRKRKKEERNGVSVSALVAAHTIRIQIYWPFEQGERERERCGPRSVRTEAEDFTILIFSHESSRLIILRRLVDERAALVIGISSPSSTRGQWSSSYLFPSNNNNNNNNTFRKKYIRGRSLFFGIIFRT